MLYVKKVVMVKKSKKAGMIILEALEKELWQKR